MIKEKKPMKEKVLGRGLQIGLVIGVVCMVFVAMNQLYLVSETDIHDEEVRELKWRRITLPFLGENNPGAGNSGVLDVIIYPHSDAIETDYATNLTNTSGYAAGGTNNSHIGSDVPYATAFDIVVKVRWHKDEAQAAGNGTFVLEWLRANITVNGNNFGLNDYNMTEQNITDADPIGDYIWVHYIAGNNATGFTIDRGENISSCLFTFDYYG